jgi:hypothetical protein
VRLTIAALLVAAPLAGLAASPDPEPLLPPPPPPDAGPAPGGEVPSDKAARESAPPSVLAPAPEAKAMAAAYIPRYHSRDAWYFGVGAGTGGATVYGDRAFATLRDLTGGDSKVGAARAEVGLTLGDRLLLGAELSMIATQRLFEGSNARVATTQADAVFTFFPEADGFFVRLGGGWSLLRRAHAGDVVNDHGFNGLAGIGYAFWVGQHFNVSLRIDHSRQRWAKGTDARTGETWAGTLGLDWY